MHRLRLPRIAAHAFVVLSALKATAFRIPYTTTTISASFHPSRRDRVVVRSDSSTIGGALGVPVVGTRYVVCLSPGCVADGAVAALRQLQALAPPGDEVVQGVCCSLCGQGPIVLTSRPSTESSTTATKHRRMKSDKLLRLILQQGHEESAVSKRLVEAYETYERASEAMSVKDYETAISLFEDAARVGYSPALDLQKKRNDMGVETLSRNGIPVALLWLVDLRTQEASAKLQQSDFEGAQRAADAACDLAGGQDMGSLDVLTQIYQARGDVIAERNALTKLAALMDGRPKLSIQESNRRRQLGFRLQKLEREAL